MVKERFNMFWHGDQLSTLDVVCMQSFIECGHSLYVFTYDPVDLPSGVERRDARQVLPRERLLQFQGDLAAFADIFRYKLLLEQGGWWVDTDVLCLRSALPACECYWAMQDHTLINNAVLKFPKSHPLCLCLYEESLKEAKVLSRWGQLGPDLVTKVLPAHGPEGHSGTTEDAYAIHYLESHFFWLPQFAPVVERRIQQSTFLHFWRSVLGRMGIDPERTPPAGSFLHRLYASRGVMPSIGDDERMTRESIATYLNQRWVHRSWVKELGRKIEDLGIPG